MFLSYYGDGPDKRMDLDFEKPFGSGFVSFTRCLPESHSFRKESALPVGQDMVDGKFKVKNEMTKKMGERVSKLTTTTGFISFATGKPFDQSYKKVEESKKYQETDWPQPDPAYSGDVMKLNLENIKPSAAGPKRPHDHVEVVNMLQDFQTCISSPVGVKGFNIADDQLATKTEFAYGGQVQVCHNDMDNFDCDFDAGYDQDSSTDSEDFD